MLPRPTAYHVLVEVTEAKDTIGKEGLILATVSTKDRNQASQETGILVSIGSSAWRAIDDGEPWAAVGDTVHFAKYEGKTLEHDGKQYRIMADNAIIAVTPKESV